MCYNIMKSVIIILATIGIIVIYISYIREDFTSIDLDELQKNLDEIKLVGDDVYNTHINHIYNNYFENNDNETDHYLDGSFPTSGRYKLPNQKLKKKNYKCSPKPIYIT